MTTTPLAAGPMERAAPDGAPLSLADRVLAVTARPGQESADLGGLLYAFRRAGARMALLCLTRGEASPLNSTFARLEAVRPGELQLAAGVLGICSVTVASFPDGGLGRHPLADLTERVWRAIRRHSPDLVLIIDPAAGGPDDAAVAAAAGAAAARAGLPVAARTRPTDRDAWVIDLGPDAPVARAIQKAAAAAHASQADALPQLVRRIDQLDGREHLRWLAYPQWTPADDDALAAAGLR